MEEKRVSGLLFLIALDFLKSKNHQWLNTLQTKLGNIFYDKYKMYPLEELDRLHKEILEGAFGGVTDDGYYQLGKFTFLTYAHTMVGATLTNVSISQEDVIKKILDLWNTVVNFGTRTLVEVNINQGYAIIEIKDDERNPSYLRGVIEQGVETIGGINVTSELIGQEKEKYQIKVYWSI